MATSAQPNFVAYLCKRFMLEKYYLIWRAEVEETSPQPISINNGAIPIPTVHIPEMAPLKQYFDIILVRADGYVFNVICIRSHLQPNAAIQQEVQKSTLLSVCRECMKYTGSVNRNKLPCNLQVLEIFKDHPTDSDRARLSQLKNSPAEGQRANIAACAVVPDHYTFWTNLSPIARFFQTQYLKRWIAEQTKSDIELLELIASSGFKIVPAILGALLSAASAFGMQYVLVQLGAKDGKLYGTADVIAGIVGTLFSVMIRPIRRKSFLQAAVTSMLFVIGWYGYLLNMGAPPTFDLALLAITIIGLGTMFGALGEGA